MTSTFAQIKKWILSHEPFRPVHMGLWIRSLYFRHYLPRFLSTPPQQVLDAGTGRGTYARFISERFPSAKVKGMDLIPAPEWNVPKPNGLSFSVGDITIMDAVDTYDLIVSVDVLEHIPGNAEVLKRFHTALMPGGVLYLAVPCEKNEIHIFPRAWFSKFHEWEEHEHIGEQRNLPEMKKLLAGIGFDVLFSRYTFTFFGTLAWEIETLCMYGGRVRGTVRVILMPFLKLLGLFDLYLPLGKGHNLIVARKV